MKIILTGATGFVGGEALKRAVAHPGISEVLVLTRRDLAAEQKANEKVKVILHADFAAYPDAVLEQLAGAEACIWTVGGKSTDFPDLETARRVQCEYSAAFARACAQSVLPTAPEKRFRFVFCSGAMAERDEKRKLSFMADTRLLKGVAENGLIEVAKETPGFDVVVLRPGGILRGGIVASIMPGMMVDVADVSDVLVGAAAGDPAVRAGEDGAELTLENGDIRSVAKALRAGSK